MKRNNGITLIALVITIIVLLILAGVSIAMLTGNNGILTQANEAKIWTDLGNVDDSYKTHILGLQASNGGQQVDLDSLTDILTKVQVGEDGYIYAIKDLTKLNLSMESGKGEIPSNVTSINDFNDVYVVDEKGNVAYILNDKVYGDVELAQEETTREDFFEFNEETGAITGIVENTTKDPNGVGYYYDDEGNQILSEKNIVIPSTINGVPVTQMLDLAFSMAPIESVVIPDSVTTIGSSSGNSSGAHGVFKYCYALKSVTIPDSVTLLGSNTFQSCTKLTDVTLSNNITNIYPYTFYRCSALENIIIPDGVTSIGNNAFRYCTSLTNIVIPDSVTSIRWSAFSDINANVNIYCEATSKPDGWSDEWTNVDASRIHWGSTGPTE